MKRPKCDRCMHSKRRIRHREGTCAPTFALCAKSASTSTTGLRFGRRCLMRELLDVPIPATASAERLRCQR
jgi:hypothetical protein